jgi:hypothetical protein
VKGELRLGGGLPVAVALSSSFSKCRVMRVRMMRSALRLGHPGKLWAFIVQSCLLVQYGVPVEDKEMKMAEG